MSDPERPRRMIKPGRALITGVSLLVLAGAAAVLLPPLFNRAGSQMVATAPCAPQPDAAGKVDAVAVGQLAALNGTGTGRGYSDMKFTDAAGKSVTLADFAGKTLLVNFWASWCIPCRAEMPALDKLAAAENDENFMVLPINLDLGEGGLDKAKAFLAEGNWANLPLYADFDLRGLQAAPDLGRRPRPALDPVD